MIIKYNFNQKCRKHLFNCKNSKIKLISEVCFLYQHKQLNGTLTVLPNIMAHQPRFKHLHKKHLAVYFKESSIDNQKKCFTERFRKIQT